MQEVNDGVAHALFGALVHLGGHACIPFRSAREEVHSKWYAMPPVCTHYVFAGESTSGDLGALENDLLSRITGWPGEEWRVNDVIAPTFADLFRSFRDSDGDFSGYQIRTLVLSDGESRGLLTRTGKGFIGKLLPGVEPASATAARQLDEGQRAITDAARRLFREHPSLGNDVVGALRQVVFGNKPDPPDPAGVQAATIRKKMILYGIGISLVLALTLSLILFFR
jgi:hypothetical protein